MTRQRSYEAILGRWAARLRKGARTLTLLAVVLTGAASLQARSLVIQSFQANIEVQPNGEMIVAEIIKARFSGSWLGIYRTIPIDYRTPSGFDYKLLIDILSVTDPMGHTLRHQIRRQGHFRRIQIWVPGAVNTSKTVVIRYRVYNGLRFFEDHDELYWNVTGNEWVVPIEAASAMIHMPAGVQGLRAAAYTGSFGSTQHDADVQINGNTVEVDTRRRLNIRQGLTVAVAWDPGVVHRPSTLQKAFLFFRSNWIFGFPLLVFAVMFWLWFTRGRDPRRRPIVPLYEPPEQMTPAEVGTLVDNQPNQRDIIASLVDLAVRGYLVIEETEKKQFLGFWSSKDYIFEQQEADWSKLLPHEREILTGIFGSGLTKRVALSDLHNKFYRELPLIQADIFDRLVERKFYTKRPDKVQRTYLFLAIMLAGAGMFVAGSSFLDLSPLSVILSCFISGAVVGVFGWLMPARTPSGARALEKILGFEEFLGRVESDRFKRMITGPEMFEKFLPFAMALGVEKHWAAAFATMLTEPPNWYRGTSAAGFQSQLFVSDLSRMTTQAASVMASSPRSSGSSGFGGGSSGGGFGGGGGGGF